MNMDALRASLLLHEGLRLKPYTDTVGKLSIGIGRNLDDVGISEKEAYAMLEADIAKCVQELHRAIPNWQKHNSARQNVLVELVFNLGMPRLQGFKKFLAALDAQNYPLAAAELMNSKWATQVGKRAETLAEQMRNG
jgi:lysozyme